MNLDVSAAPEAAQLARMSAAPPFGKEKVRSSTLTAGRLAGLLRAAAAEPTRWWHLAGFDPERQVQVRLEAAAGWELWLITTPPGYCGTAHDHGPGGEVVTVVAGELRERTITAAGMAELPLLPNRIRVHGRGHLRETVNPGNCYAVSLCARAPAPSPRPSPGPSSAATSHPPLG